MATPTTNSVSVTDFNPVSIGLGRYTTSGSKWGGALGTGVTLTYSFPIGTASFATNYGGLSTNEWSAWSSLSTGERASVRTALSIWSQVANISFTETVDTSSTVGELRFAYTNFDTASEAAHAYYPGSTPEAGDVWLSTANFNSANLSSIPLGSDDFHTLLHEIGHSVGLKHSFEAPNAIPASQDNFFYTVMSYSARVSGDSGYASFYPTTPMYNDLLALQAMYGRKLSHNSGDTTYTFVQNARYFQTIDDAGGNDTIQYSGTLGVTINLYQGTFSSVSAPITFDGGVTSRSTVAIGPNSVIERAIGGSGNDLLYGNGVANQLFGQNANDSLYGGAGNDVLNGGAGNDRLSGGAGVDYLTGYVGRDTFQFDGALNAATNADRIADFVVVDDTVLLENAVFTRFGASGTLNTAFFVTNTTAQDANDYIVYSKALGTVSYDVDGSGAAFAPIKFATVTANLALTNFDFFVI